LLNNKMHLPMSDQKKWLAGTGLLAVIAASLCCITPVIALIAGVSGIASTFSWLEPARPWLLLLAGLSLGLAWWVYFRNRRKEIACDCEPGEKKPFLQSGKFLSIITVLAVILSLFPYYSDVFYRDPDPVISGDNVRYESVVFKVKGMTCTGCEEHIDHEVKSLAGVADSKSDYAAGETIVSYNPGQLDADSIEAIINSTGYEVIARVPDKNEQNGH